MKRALFLGVLLVLAGLLMIGCTKDDKENADAGIDAAMEDETDAGGDTDDDTARKKCTEVGPLHHCVGLDDCALPLFNLRPQFTCPPFFVCCCVDCVPSPADSGVDSGG